MEVLHPRCAGLDVHKDTVVAAVRCVSAPRHLEVRTFGTTTSQLLELGEWLSSHGCTHVAMEATGVYWKPVWHILEGNFELILADAQHIRNVPGRKTDVSDAAWVADLLAHGLVRGSFVPPAPVQELRDLTRTRKQLVREIAQHTLRLQKVLEDANLKVASVLSNILGLSGRSMIAAALIAGETDPERLADLAQGLARKKKKELTEALRGRITPHHRGLLKLHMQLIDALEAALQEVDASVGKALEPIRMGARLLTAMPGVSDIVANVIVAEIGVDMSRFPSAAHLVSWAGLCPRNDESANVALRACAREPMAQDNARSRLPGPLSDARPPTCTLSFCASKEGAVQKKRPSRLPRRCSPPPSTSFETERNTAISDPSTSPSATSPKLSPVRSDGSVTSASRSNSSPARRTAS